MIENNRLKLYMVDIKYVRDLHNADNRVTSVSPQIGKENRVYIGVLTVCGEHKYIIPLHHAKEKYIKMKSAADFEKVFDKKGRLLSVLDFGEMIPVENNQLIEVDLKIHKNDSSNVIAYKNLCINELSYCRHGNMPKIISDKADALYHLCTDDNSNYKGKKWCLDFKKLEEVCVRYNQKH